MPTYEISRRHVLLTITLDAASEDEARWFAQQAWVEEAKQAAQLAEVKRQPMRPDDTGDTRSETRYEYSEGDVADDAAEAFRWGFTADGREPEDCGREQ